MSPQVRLAGWGLGSPQGLVINCAVLQRTISSCHCLRCTAMCHFQLFWVLYKWCQPGGCDGPVCCPALGLCVPHQYLKPTTSLQASRRRWWGASSTKWEIECSTRSQRELRRKTRASKSGGSSAVNSRTASNAFPDYSCLLTALLASKCQIVASLQWEVLLLYSQGRAALQCCAVSGHQAVHLSPSRPCLCVSACCCCCCCCCWFHRKRDTKAAELDFRVPSKSRKTTGAGGLSVLDLDNAGLYRSASRARCCI